MKIDFNTIERWLCDGNCHSIFRSRYTALRMKYGQGQTYNSIGDFYGISTEGALQLAKNIGWMED